MPNDPSTPNPTALTPLNSFQLEDVIEDVELALAAMIWREEPPQPDAGVLRMFRGASDPGIGAAFDPNDFDATQWTALLVEFYFVDDDGVQTDARGREGSITNASRGLIVRLPPASVEAAWTLAVVSSLRDSIKAST